MHFRYVFYYLLCLYMCIDSSFCNQFTAAKDLYHHVDKVSKLRVGACKVHKRSRRHQLNDELVTNLDLASFIQKPEEEFGSEYYRSMNYRRQKSKRLTKNERKYGYISENSQIARNIAPEKDSTDEDVSNAYPGKQPSGVAPITKQNKLFKMKVPFFSHEQPDKKKKKTMFHHRQSLHSKTGPESNMKQSRFKRSGKHCPPGKKKFTTKKPDHKSEKSSSKMVHNSRQFYQDISNFIKAKPKKLAGNVSATSVHPKRVQEKNEKSSGDETKKSQDEHKLKENPKYNIENKENIVPIFKSPEREFGNNNNIITRTAEDWSGLQRVDRMIKIGELDRTRQLQELDELERKLYNVQGKNLDKRQLENMFSLEKLGDTYRMRQLQEIEAIERKLDQAKIKEKELYSKAAQGNETTTEHRRILHYND